MEAHQACAIVMMSPHGFSGSPYLPACLELKSNTVNALLVNSIIYQGLSAPQRRRRRQGQNEEGFLPVKKSLGKSVKSWKASKRLLYNKLLKESDMKSLMWKDISALIIYLVLLAKLIWPDDIMITIIISIIISFSYHHLQLIISHWSNNFMQAPDKRPAGMLTPEISIFKSHNLFWTPNHWRLRMPNIENV